MLLTIFYGLLGAFSCRFRGGLWGEKVDSLLAKIPFKPLAKVLDTLLKGKITNGIIWATAVTALVAVKSVGAETFLTGSAVIWLYNFMVMMRFSAPGWGVYIGAILRNEVWSKADQSIEEVDYIDKIIAPLLPKPILYGMAGLSIRCGEWGLMLGVPLVAFIGFNALWFALIGLLAGPLVFVLTKLSHRAWEWFEAILGMVWFVAALWSLS